MWLTIDASANRAQLIEGEFGVGHCFEVVVEGHPLSMNTPSLESMAEVMTGIKRCCDIGHMGDEALKTHLVAGLTNILSGDRWRLLNAPRHFQSQPLPSLQTIPCVRGQYFP